MTYSRPQAGKLARRLAERRRFIQTVAGPRQAGKTTLVRQVIEGSGLAARYASADEPTLRGPDWIGQQWEAARLAARDAGRRGAVLVLDEIQKIPAGRRPSSACGTRTRARSVRSKSCSSARRRCSSSAG